MEQFSTWFVDNANAIHAAAVPADARRWAAWVATLRRGDGQREAEIDAFARQPVAGVNPIDFLARLDAFIDDRSVLVADGGDFVATAAYVIRPRGPLRWLDPGPFGTLGVGAGFAMGARLCHPDDEVWLLYGDGAAGYSLQELDTCVRHGLPVIAVVGNDAAWAQIARDQIKILEDPVGTTLRRTDYHIVAQGYGAKGIVVRTPDQIDPALTEARESARRGVPVLINVWLGATDFREGSISM